MQRYVFVVKKSDTGETVFEAPLKERTCAHPRCDFDATIGGPYCARHTISTLGITVRPSRGLASIGVQGNGVFTTRRFVRGDVVCQYECERVTNEDLSIRYGDGVNVYTARDPLTRRSGTYADAALDRVVASLINDSRGIAGATHNVTFARNPKRRFAPYDICALRDIEKGEELFLNYGDDYWAPPHNGLTTYETIVAHCPVG